MAKKETAAVGTGAKNPALESALAQIQKQFGKEAIMKMGDGSQQNIEAISSASYQTLMDIDEVGEVIANSVMEFFANEQNRNIVNRLKEAGLQFALGQAEEQASNKLEGLSIVISGTFERYSRDELKQLIEAHGGKNVSSISSKTDYVLAGANMGHAKLEKANALGVKIMSEADFIKMIE